MSYGSRGGVPVTRRITVDGQSVYNLPLRSAEIVLRPQSGSARLYWTREDFLADPDGQSDTADAYMDLNGEAYPGEVRLRASIVTLYLRGSAVIEVTLIGQG